MTQEDKDLLLKDLCARLPYGVKILYESWNYEWDQELSLLERVVGIDDKFIYTKIIDTHTGDEYRDDKHPIDTFDGRPYLRPMSSIASLISAKEWSSLSGIELIDWYNANHIDYRGLIEKGLAIAVTKENNPYAN